MAEGIYVAVEVGCGCRTAVLFAESVKTRERDRILGGWAAGGRRVERLTEEEYRQGHLGRCPHQEPAPAPLQEEELEARE